MMCADFYADEIYCRLNMPDSGVYPNSQSFIKVEGLSHLSDKMKQHQEFFENLSSTVTLQPLLIQQESNNC